MKLINSILVIILSVSGIVANNYYLENFNPDSLRYKISYATRCIESPSIDGRLDDESWNMAIPISEFFQLDPIEFGPPSEKTVVRVLYDDQALYISFENFDSEPDKIRKPLTRRDAYMDGFASSADFVGFAIDSKNDDYNGKWFGVNAAGVKIDVNVSGNEEYDRSWDAVWDAAVEVNDRGYTVEVMVPFSVFQFENKIDQVWGISFNRHIHKNQEEVIWPGHRKSHVGTVSSFGVLLGLKDIPEPKKVELIPYALSSLNENENDYNLGADVRYGVSSNAVINATVNPDFGQVEADPSVLNLSAYETFYEEKRPFFSEGANFFQHRLQLFHSRRIGNAPGYFSPDSGDLEDVPGNTTILGAFKILGTTKSGFNYGLINATTNEELGTIINSDGQKEDFVVEPRTNYAVGRVEKSFINKFSRVGIMGTNVRRENAESASVAGLDWKIGLINNRLFSNGQIVRSNTDQTGNAFRFNVGYTDPVWWSTRIWFGTYDNKFEINDLGYLRRNDLTWTGVMFEARRREPWGYFLGSSIEFKYKKEWRGDGLILEDALELETWTLLKNYWRFGFESKIMQPAYNDEDIYRDDRAWAYSTEKFLWNDIWIKSDRRKKLILGVVGGIGNGKLRGKGYFTQLQIDYKPIEPLNISIEASQDLSPTYMQYVDIIDIDNSINRVYAQSEQLTKRVEFRIDWTFSPELSLQGYYQPYYADMKYLNYFELMSPETMNLQPFDYLSLYENPDFKWENRVGTFVIRWEYNPGSTLFLVYNMNEYDYYSTSDDSWSSGSSNAIVFKLNYWLKI
mgnify:FL=1